ncbi:MAG TPA: hypothetical protein VGW40_02735 [Allosphingosinicella sp.]|nr:hypothetical protein [Allosphingosinicella sp.]
MNAKPPAGTAPTGGDAFAEAHRRLLGDGTIQFDLPSVNQPPPQPAPDFSGTLPFLKAFFWIAVAAIALFLLYLIVQRLTGAQWPWWRRAEAEEEPAAANWRPEAREARGLLGEADALAAEGRFSEAARLLLFRSIADIDSRRPDLVRPALTSRDIAALDAIPGRPRSAFGRIAMLVERSLFAARPLAAGDWQDCRAAYEEFAFAEGWRG